MTCKERREWLKSLHRCVVCGKKLEQKYIYLRCIKCRLSQAEASKKYHAKTRIKNKKGV